MTRQYDVFCMGRSSIDLYSNDIGAPFTEIKSFSAYVGGCPTNVSVGARRLGILSCLLTAVGVDPVGDFVLKFLEREKVETKFIPRKKDKRTSAVLLGIEPPDKFPLVFYRDNCADMELTEEDVQKAPVGESRMLFLTGTGLSREPSRSATLFAVERARESKTKIALDLDFRLDQWENPLEYGEQVRALLPSVDFAIGTEEEVKAATLKNPAFASASESQISNPEVAGDVRASARELFQGGLSALVLKKGAKGSEIVLSDNSSIEVPPFSVKIVNVLGAGDAFAAGFLYGFLKGWDWYRSARMGNACGAIVATRHGCANFMPYEEEALRFVDENGGF